MRIVYLGNAEPSLSGGMISVLLTVDALRALGHDASVVATQPAPGWAPVSVPWTVAEGRPPPWLEGADAVVTGMSGVEDALRTGAAVVGHLCAGYEKHLWPWLAEQVEYVYRLPTVKMVVAPHLQRTLRDDVGVDSFFVGTSLDASWFRRRGSRTAGGRRTAGARRTRGGPLRVLSVGADPGGRFAPVPFKGIANVIEVVRRLRDRGHDVELVRLAPRADPSMRSELVDERHVAVLPREVPAVYHSCDIYLSASTEAEGLGKPAIEAAMSGLASVLPAIPPYEDIPDLAEAALLYPPGDLDEATRQMERLLADRELRERLQEAGPGLEIDHLFSPAAVAGRVVAALGQAGPPR